MCDVCSTTGPEEAEPDTTLRVGAAAQQIAHRELDRDGFWGTRQGTREPLRLAINSQVAPLSS
jgi:hypothetical protein